MPNRAHKLKIMAICGTRPDTVKMAPIVNDLKKRSDKVDLTLVVTGQHREMLEQVLRAFDLHPNYDLHVMAAKQTLTQLTVRVLEGLDELISQLSPNLVLAQGDTSSTFVASLASFYNKVPFGHVEAGLRTDNKYDPFPEEMNRRLSAVIADLHFAPTPTAKANLLREGVREADIFVTGNTVIDALLSISQQEYKFEDPRICEAIKSDKMILVTAHRRENWGERMEDICKAVLQIVEENPEVHVLFPVHRNPIVRETVYPILENKQRITLIEPPDYVPFVHLIKHSYLVLTDSGGVQEEAPSLGRPVLVLRETTERPEGVEAGNAKLIGTLTENIVTNANLLLRDRAAYDSMSQVSNPYGDGSSAEKTWQAISTRFGI